MSACPICGDSVSDVVAHLAKAFSLKVRPVVKWKCPSCARWVTDEIGKCCASCKAVPSVIGVGTTPAVSGTLGNEGASCNALGHDRLQGGIPDRNPTFDGPFANDPDV